MSELPVSGRSGAAHGGDGQVLSTRQAFTDWLPVVLVWSCLLALPFGRWVELPMLIMSIWGIVLMVRHGGDVIWRGPYGLFAILFLCFWLPGLLSLPDAVNVDKTLRVVLTELRYYFAGVFVIRAMASPLAQRRFLRLSAWVLVFWIADALFQVVVGVDVFGFEHQPRRINGVFGDHPRLGIMLAIFFPLLFEQMRRHWPRWAQVVTFIAALVVVVLAGSRAGWVNFAVVVAGAFAWWWYSRGRFPWLAATASVVLAVGTAIVAYQVSAPFASRMDQTLQVLKGDYEGINEAISGRLPIWGVAVRMAQDHPINGVGARDFRYAYDEYARVDDPLATSDREVGAHHAHQMVLGIAAETGLTGLAGLLIMLGLLVRAWWQADDDTRVVVLPLALALLAGLFPINTHFAMHSSFWGQALWWLIAIYCAGLYALRAPAPAFASARTRASAETTLSQTAAVEK